MKIRFQFRRRARSMFPILALLVWALIPQGCLRMEALPTAKPQLTLPLGEPRLQDRLQVPRVKSATSIYRVGAKDVLTIDVLKDPTLSKDYPVTDEGYILVPHIGPMKVAEMTTQEIEQHLNEVLSEFIREPNAKVGVKDYLSKVVYVVGAVARPGPQVMKADQLTLREAVFAAGLPTPAAALNRTHVITPADEKPIVYQIDLTDILYKGKMAENILLKPDDIVFVPSRYTLNLTDSLRDLLYPFDEYYSLQYRATFGQAFGGGGGGGGGLGGLP